MKRWAALWANTVDIHVETALESFKNSCCFTALVSKLNYTSRRITTVGQILEIARLFALDDPTPESDDEDHMGHRSNGNGGGSSS